jgi:hypothetical protein
MPDTIPVTVAFNRSGLTISPSTFVISIPIPIGVPPPVWSNVQWKELIVSNLSLALLITWVAVSDAGVVVVVVVVDLAQPIDSAIVTSKQRARVTNFDRLIILCLQNMNSFLAQKDHSWQLLLWRIDIYPSQPPDNIDQCCTSWHDHFRVVGERLFHRL